ncbi:PTS sugar transporter subunit IIB [Lachnospiraceae bacterium 54-53]
MKIHLVCSAGMSTSLLVNNMKKSAPEGYEIDAGPFAELEDIVDNYDVILVGPQVRFKYDDIKAVCYSHGKKCELIDMRVYGRMDGVKALEIAMNAK